ncbi:hypothetical protein [Actinoplanes subtropicus]|uniref:hypothetical protein n=1 Tax=Actinoplanes subtropicus TaxID=543632 RepID=UPI0004C32524|nr:hypothetical protein [Actinoplanes subtropicus]
MSSESIVPASLPPARPGDTTCTTIACRRTGSVVAPPRCPACGNRVHLVQDGEPVPKPLTTIPQPAPAALGAGEILSRTIFGGFWALVTLGLVIAGLTGMAAGEPKSLLALVAAVLTGLYARYIFRGGRFRMLFW